MLPVGQHRWNFCCLPLTSAHALPSLAGCLLLPLLLVMMAPLMQVASAVFLQQLLCKRPAAAQHERDIHECHMTNQ